MSSLESCQRTNWLTHCTITWHSCTRIHELSTLEVRCWESANHDTELSRCTTDSVFSHYCTSKQIKRLSARGDIAIVIVTLSTRSFIPMPSGYTKSLPATPIYLLFLSITALNAHFNSRHFWTHYQALRCHRDKGGKKNAVAQKTVTCKIDIICCL